MSNLTRRQQETLEAIVDYQKRMGFPPTVLELAGLIGVSSPNAAVCHVNALKRKGVISVAPGAARGITVLSDDNLPNAVSIIIGLLGENAGAREQAVAWLEEQGVEL